MIDCHNDLLTFYKKQVRLDTFSKESLKTARDTCSNNVKSGLAKNGDPAPIGFVLQGSFAMEAVVQHSDYKYDIDYGIVFSKESLVGLRGADKTPRDARQMVANAFKDKRFDSEPIVKTNCVRFPYAAGYHVDMPVYRESKNLWGTVVWEIASGDNWVESKPKGVTAWFEAAVTAQSPDAKDDGQMRRMTCLLKAVEKTRVSYNWPSGFIVSVLVKDKYVSDERDDIAFIKTIRAIVRRLNEYTSVDHPVVGGKLAQENDTAVCWMRDKLADFDAKFKELEEPECSPGHAMKIWDDIFGTDWFIERSKEAADKIGFGIPVAAVAAPSAFSRPPDAGRYGSGRSG
jgi:hypothetical protein